MNPDEFKTELAASADALAAALTAIGGLVAGLSALAVFGYVCVFHSDALIDGVNELLAAPDRLPYPVAVLAATATLAAGVAACGAVPAAGRPPRYWRLSPADFRRPRRPEPKFKGPAARAAFRR